MDTERPHWESPPNTTAGPAAAARAASGDTTELLSRPIAPILPAFDSIPGYTLLEELHRGGQGVVFRAIQHSTQRHVAIKVMKEGPLADAQDRARFEREVRLLAQLKHPNIVAIHDSGEAARCFYYVMDFIAGPSLDEYIASLHGRGASRGASTDDAAARPTLRHALLVFARICDAVQAAHERSIIHRDLKPSNVRLDEKGEPHVLDFGLAKSVASDAGQTVTAAGQFFGSLPWASPEQAEGATDRIGVRSDVYSLGVILYQLLTATFPYDVRGATREVLDRIVHVEATRPRARNPALDRDLETIALKCLQKNPARRYASAGEIARDIGHYLSAEPIEARRDSVAYIARTRSRAAVNRHPIVVVLTVLVLVSVFLAASFVDTFISRRTKLDAVLERFLARHFPPTPVGQTLDQVRTIALTKDTDVNALAKKLELKGFSLKDGKSMRLLHGRLMERLVGSGCGGVTLALRFKDPSPFDTDLIAGLRALRDAGIPVVVSVHPWQLDGGESLSVAPPIRPEVRSGCVVAGLSGKSAWKLQLAAEREQHGFEPSLALAAFSAFRHPREEFDIRRADAKHPALDLQYFTHDDQAPRNKLWTVRDRIELTTFMTGGTPFEGFTPENGLRQGDTVAFYYLDMPSDQVLASSTIEYSDVFSASDFQLREWFGGKAIVVSDFRSDADWFEHPDGRSIPGPYSHAVGLDTLLRNVPIRLPRRLGIYGLPALGGLIACLIALSLPRRHALRMLLLAACTIMFLVAAVCSYWRWRYLFNPLVPVLALWVVAEVAAAVQRIRRRSA
jgi:serine/threonine protein kinase